MIWKKIRQPNTGLRMRTHCQGIRCYANMKACTNKFKKKYLTLTVWSPCWKHRNGISIYWHHQKLNKLFRYSNTIVTKLWLSSCYSYSSSFVRPLSYFRNTKIRLHLMVNSSIAQRQLSAFFSKNILRLRIRLIE